MLSFITALLIGQVQIISEPSREPTFAAACQCQAGGECVCGDNCDCAPAEVKPVISVAKFPRVTPTSPITIAPDPDNDISTHPDLLAFIERHADGKSKTWTGTQLIETPKAAAAQPQSQSRPSPVYKPVPVERAAMVWSCQGGVCEWRPAAQAPTKSVQRTYQRRGLLRRWR